MQADSAYTMDMLRRMSLRWRLALALAGFALICFACLALAYSLWPSAQHETDRLPVTPTLFAPPQSFAELWEVE